MSIYSTDMYKQRKTPVKVHIYSQNNFLAEILKLNPKRCRVQSYAACAYPKFDFIHHQNVIVIHYSSTFDTVLEWSDKLHAVCKFIVITTQAELAKIGKHKNVHTMCSPIHYEDLFKSIDIALPNLCPISQNIVLNTELRLLVKIKDKNIEVVSLTDKELALILYLQDKADGVRRDDILHRVFGYSSLTETHTLETHISRLRSKVGHGLRFIEHRNNFYKLSIEENTP